ncbi:MAG: HAD hydrolase family protein [Bacteroidetes bacterium]|nr:HAD hydrolase family protein [Bacteroidota bacterium]
MSANFKQRLTKITTLIFDVDGVLSDGKVFFMPDGTPVRNLNMKDSYALQLAVKKGFRVLIITGGNSEVLKKSLHTLGIEHVFLKQHDKLSCYKDCMAEFEFTDEQALYMGDDLPDYETMQRVHIACCPNDAVSEIKKICIYISDKKGGDGCVRDIIEQVLRSQQKWEITHW